MNHMLTAMLIATTVLPLQQNLDVSHQPADVVILNQQWGTRHTSMLVDNPGSDAQTSVGRNQSLSMPDLPTYSRVVRKEASMLVRNDGPKWIKTIEWDYIFFTSPEAKKELRRYRFLSKTKIKPGETKFVTADITDLKRTDHCSAPGCEKVTINMITYSDGTKWRHL